jgi:hypothetical protein
MQGLGLHGQVPVRLRLPHSPRVVQGPEDPLHLPHDQPAQAQVPVREQHLPSPWTLGAQSVCTVMYSDPHVLVFVEITRVYVWRGGGGVWGGGGWGVGLAAGVQRLLTLLYGDVCPTLGCAVALRFGDPHDISKFQSYPLLQSEV